jgi:hypothetical protein
VVSNPHGRRLRRPHPPRRPRRLGGRRRRRRVLPRVRSRRHVLRGSALSSVVGSASFRSSTADVQTLSSTTGAVHAPGGVSPDRVEDGGDATVLDGTASKRGL